jgi:purine nucleosidase
VLDISHTRSSASNPPAAAVALEEGPQLVATRAATVDVELTGTLTRGMTVTDWSGRWG